jgi:hypothetical protein
MNVWSFVMVGGGIDNNRLGFNGKCEPVVLFIQNHCIQWMDEFLYMKQIQRFSMIQNGWRPEDG